MLRLLLPMPPSQPFLLLRRQPHPTAAIARGCLLASSASAIHDPILDITRPRSSLHKDRSLLTTRAPDKWLGAFFYVVYVYVWCLFLLLWLSTLCIVFSSSAFCSCLLIAFCVFVFLPCRSYASLLFRFFACLLPFSLPQLLRCSAVVSACCPVFACRCLLILGFCFSASPLFCFFCFSASWIAK